MVVRVFWSTFERSLFSDFVTC